MKEEIISSQNSIWEVWKIATRLGFTSFGGPIAHLAYFREEYVDQRKWLDEKSYGELVALCQFLPGPTSSQVGMGIGLMRAGLGGAIASWIGFTLPSVLTLIFFALLFQNGSTELTHYLHGLLVVAVAVVAHAVWGMAKTLAPDRPRATIALLAAFMSLLIPTPFGQVGILLLAGVGGWFYFSRQNETKSYATSMTVPIRRPITWIFLSLFFILLLLFPLLTLITDSPVIALVDGFYRAGSLVFGGGHVVLPLLQAEVVPTGWVTSDEFLAGYGLAQAVPGPLFTFASYLGMVAMGWKGAILATIAIFLPSFLLVIGTLPYWNWLRHQPSFQSALKGINAAVVGILLAALYDPVWTKAIQNSYDFGLALICFGLLSIWKVPAWIVLFIGTFGGFLVSFFY